MLTIDGRHGEGGGQILRSSLSLSGITGQAVRIHHIRGGRAKPGLMRQHLTAVKAAAQVCSAHVEGAELKSQEIIFTPGPITGGQFHFAIGSGGSTCLVLQTVLPMLLRAEQASTVIVEGGTHNPLSPVFDFLNDVFAPQLWAMGLGVSFELERAGFMSTGGGRIVMTVQPATSSQPLSLLQRGKLTRRLGMVHQSGLAYDVVLRLWYVVNKRLGYQKNELKLPDYKEATGPGNALCVAQHYENVVYMATSVGALGKAAERVAKEACNDVSAYMKHDAPVDEYLADQLLLPMAICSGGRFRTAALSEHSRSNIDVIGWFLGTESIQVVSSEDFNDIEILPSQWAKKL